MILKFIKAIKNVCYCLNTSILSGEGPADMLLVSDAADVDVFVKDLMSSESHDLERSPITSVPVYKAKGQVFPDNVDFINKAEHVLAEVFMNVEYTDVFGDPCVVPFAFVGFKETDSVEIIMIPKRNVTAQQIRELHKTYRQNKIANRAMELLKNLPPHDDAPDGEDA